MKKQKRGTDKKKKFVVLLVFVSIILIFIYNLRNKDTNEIMVVSKIDDYNYVLDSNETRVYKKYFKDLEKLLKSDYIDEKEYASLISKLFIIDFYTLNNKLTNQDVGGLQFINSNIKDEFYSKSVNTIYKYVKSNIYGERYQNLPEVKDVEIENIKSIKFDEGGIKDDICYEVVCSIYYKKDLGYAKKIVLRLVHEDGNKLTIVEINEE